MSSAHVPEGYKQTEIGVIPEDWDVVTIREITSLVTNGFVGKATDHYTDKDNGITYIQGYNVEENSFNLNGIKKVTPEFHRLHQKSCLKKDDLLTIQTGEVGLTTIIPEYLVGSNCHALIISRFKKEKAYPWFYAHYFNSLAGRLRLRDLEVGTTMKHINVGDLLPWEVPYPPQLEEQRAIAQALSDVDALITSLDKLIAKQRQLKTAAMQQLLTGKMRLPGFSGEWIEKQIDTEIDLLTGYPFPSSKYSKSGIKLLRGSNIKRGITDWAEDLIQYWSEITSDISQYVLKDGDIVIAMDGSLVGRSFARLSKSDLPALLLQRVARIRSEKIEMGYLKEWICSKFFVEHCDAVKTVTAIPHISPSDIKNFKIQIPPNKEEQRAIATVLSDMDTTIAALEARRAKTQAIKQGMMQELLTGRTRLV